MSCGDDRSSDPSQGLLFCVGWGRTPWKGTGSVEKGTSPRRKYLEKPTVFC